MQIVCSPDDSKQQYYRNSYMRYRRLWNLLIPVLVWWLGSSSYSYAQYSMDYAVSMVGNAGNGTFAPYYFSANKHGLVTHSKSGYLRAALSRDIEMDKRFSYEFGVDLVGLLSSTSPVTYYDATQGVSQRRPQVSAFLIQQLYAGIKYRKIFISAGSRELTDPVVNFELSSGGLVWSGNSRPIPQVRAGFIDFVDIPFTKGWVQIKGDLAYGKFMDDNFYKEHYNYYNHYITTGALYHHKSISFRTNPNKPFVVTIGAELAAQFGGTKHYYLKGVRIDSLTTKSPTRLKDFLQILFPSSGDGSTNVGDQAYYYGNHVGHWNLSAEYTFKNKSSVRGYFEWYYDDASGMGKLNGWDGLWGVEYKSGRQNWLSDLVVEYVDFTNQGGPLNWCPTDYDNPQLTTEATGFDDYYNNYFYNGWMHYGLSNGTPMAKSPLYNTDGYMRYKYNRMRAVHLGAMGYIAPEWMYKVLASYRTSWGSMQLPLADTQHDLSGLIECRYTPVKLSGWTFSFSLAGDYGKLYGDKWGVSIGIKKSGILTIGK